MSKVVIFMARKCSVCEHPQIESINAALVAGKPLSGIVTEHSGITKTSLFRHKESHLPETLSKAKEARDIAQADDLLSQVQFLQNKALSILKQAEVVKEWKTALQGVREARSCLELLGKVSGQLPPEKIMLQLEPTINQIVFILRQEIHDPSTLQRISRRLLQEAGSEGGIIDV